MSFPVFGKPDFKPAFGSKPAPAPSAPAGKPAAPPAKGAPPAAKPNPFVKKAAGPVGLVSGPCSAHHPAKDSHPAHAAVYAATPCAPPYAGRSGK